MRERPGQSCLSSEPASRWRPTRDSTGWKCLQNTLTHWQRKTPLHSCFPAIVCRASCVCIFILHLFIMFHVTFFPISFLLFFLIFFAASRCSWEPGRPRVSCSTAQPSFGSTDGGTAEQDKGRVIGRKSTNCPPALPFGRKTTAVQKPMLKSNVGRGISTCFVLPPLQSPQPHSVLQIWCRYFGRHHGKAATLAVKHRNPPQPTLLCAEWRQTGWWYSLPLSRIRPVSKQDCSYNQIWTCWSPLKVSKNHIVSYCGNRNGSNYHPAPLAVRQLGGKAAWWAASTAPK